MHTAFATDHRVHPMLHGCLLPRARTGLSPNTSCLYPLPSACSAVKHPHNHHVHAEDEDEYRRHSQRGEQRGEYAVWL
jgi:hypothetical protein